MYLSVSTSFPYVKFRNFFKLTEQHLLSIIPTKIDYIFSSDPSHTQLRAPSSLLRLTKIQDFVSSHCPHVNTIRNQYYYLAHLLCYAHILLCKGFIILFCYLSTGHVILTHFMASVHTYSTYLLNDY